MTEIPRKAGKPNFQDISEILFNHNHNRCRVYPSLQAGIILTAGNVDWGEGAWTEIIPANTIDDAFDIHRINIEASSDEKIYEIILGAGEAGSEVEIARRRIGTSKRASEIFCMTPMINANTRIAAKVACETKDKTITISLQYHQY